jgi:DNA-binding NarL/FixJ family response regulator
MAIRLLIADDHEAVRLGLVNLLAGTGIEVVAQAANGKECFTLADKHKPAVVLLDLRLPEAANGLKTLQKLRQKVPCWRPWRPRARRTLATRGRAWSRSPGW